MRMHIRRSFGKNSYQNGGAVRKRNLIMDEIQERFEEGEKQSEIKDSRISGYIQYSNILKSRETFPFFFLAPPAAIRAEDEASGYAPSKQSHK